MNFGLRKQNIYWVVMVYKKNYDVYAMIMLLFY